MCHFSIKATQLTVVSVTLLMRVMVKISSSVSDPFFSCRISVRYFQGFTPTHTHTHTHTFLLTHLTDCVKCLLAHIPTQPLQKRLDSRGQLLSQTSACGSVSLCVCLCVCVFVCVCLWGCLLLLPSTVLTALMSMVPLDSEYSTNTMSSFRAVFTTSLD